MMHSRKGIIHKFHNPQSSLNMPFQILTAIDNQNYANEPIITIINFVLLFIFNRNQINNCRSETLNVFLLLLCVFSPQERRRLVSDANMFYTCCRCVLLSRRDSMYFSLCPACSSYRCSPPAETCADTVHSARADVPRFC